MLLLLLVWLLIYLIASVSGFILLRVLRMGDCHRVSQTETVLTGLIGLVIITQITSVFWPTDYRMAGLWLIGGCLLNWRLSNLPLRMAVHSLLRVARFPLVWLVSGIIVLFSTGQPDYYDSGLYHLPAIRWYEQLPVVPGLGNLHGRLAFNSSFFVLSAAFGLTTLVGQTLFALNGFTLIVFCTYLMGCIHRSSTAPAFRVLAAVLVALALYYLLPPVSSPTPDIWATLLPIFVFLFWLDDQPAGGEHRFYVVSALVLLCLTVKLGTLPMLLFLPLLLRRRHQEPDRFPGLKFLVPGILLIGPWLLRNVIMSGYLLYPFPALDLFSVDWKIPLPAAQYEADYVTFWARFHISEPGMNPAWLSWPLLRWLPVWWRVSGDALTFGYFSLNRPLFVAACLSPLAMAVHGLRTGRQSGGRLWQAYGVAFSGFLFWFFKAPEFRFGYAFLWMAALLPWLPLLDGWITERRSRWAIWLPVVVAVCQGFTLLDGKHPFTIRSLGIPNWYGYRDAMRNDKVAYVPYRTQSGLRVLRPASAYGEQRCYDIDQLCSPYYINDLQKRGVSLRDGFRRRALPSSVLRP